MKKKKKTASGERSRTVFVGMSGGVDSSVSAALLKQEGYEVVGVFIKTWHPDFLACNEEEERRDAMRVAAHLDIPFLTFDLEDVYKKEVADYMIAEYKAGRTPNPDVMCNKEVKFGAFLKKSLAMGADYVATGHYAVAKPAKEIFSALPASGLRHVKNFPSRASQNLLKGVDPTKDQCYFLWTLKQEQLKHILFPVGHLKKTAVRKLAKKFKLPVAEKKDSQGICFLGAVDLKEFLKHYIKSKKGEVILVPSEVEGDTEGLEHFREKKDNVIGHHDGAVFYTLGERHGFVIEKKNPDDKPYYVVGKDIKKNILFVSPKKALVAKAGENTAFCLAVEHVNWICEKPKENKNYTAQIRYHGEFLPCKIKCQRDTLTAEIIFEKPIIVASGQSIVVYDGNICLGGGVII